MFIINNTYKEKSYSKPNTHARYLCNGADGQSWAGPQLCYLMGHVSGRAMHCQMSFKGLMVISFSSSVIWGFPPGIGSITGANYSNLI